MAKYTVQSCNVASALCRMIVALIISLNCVSAHAKGPFEVFKDTDGGVHFWAAPKLSRFDECLSGCRKRKEQLMCSSCVPMVAYYTADIGLFVHFPAMKYPQAVNTKLQEVLSRTRRDKIRSIEVPFTEIDDADVLGLDGCDNLVNLDLGGTKITSASTEVLGTLKGLENVALNDTQVDDSVLGALSRLKHLKSISVGGTKVSYSGLEQLIEAQSLQKVFMHGLHDPQGEMTFNSDSIEVIDLSFNDLRGKVRLKNLPKLQHLYLVDSKIDEAFVADLENVPSGTRVYFRKKEDTLMIPAELAQRLEIAVGQKEIVVDDVDSDDRTNSLVFELDRPSWRK